MAVDHQATVELAADFGEALRRLTEMAYPVIGVWDRLADDIARFTAMVEAQGREIERLKVRDREIERLKDENVRLKRELERVLKQGRGEER